MKPLSKYTKRITARSLCLTKYPLKDQPGIRMWKKEIIAKYYSMSLSIVIKNWIIEEKVKISAEDIINGYYLLMTNSIFDLIDKKERS